MNYDELANEAVGLSYRDKFRLAQLLIQLARKEEEGQNPEERPVAPEKENSSKMTEYVAKRIRKLRPAKKDSLLNSISAMFQFQGGISESDRNRVVAELQKKHHIRIEANNHVSYPE
jgi:hypothetical protein